VIDSIKVTTNLPCFDQIRQQLPGNASICLKKDTASMSSDFWAGYISGAVGICVGNPLDVVKVQLQAGYRGSIVSSNVSKVRSAGALFKGMSLSMISCYSSGLIQSLPEQVQQPLSWHMVLSILFSL
jgi:Mitochondrial carrier protein